MRNSVRDSNGKISTSLTLKLFTSLNGFKCRTKFTVTTPTLGLYRRWFSVRVSWKIQRSSDNTKGTYSDSFSLDWS